AISDLHPGSEPATPGFIGHFAYASKHMNTNDLIYHNQRRSSTEFHRSPERSEGSLVVKIIVATKDETAMNLRRDSVPYPASHRIIVLRSVENEHETQHSPPIYSYHFVSFKYRNGPGFSHTQI